MHYQHFFDACFYSILQFLETLCLFLKLNFVIFVSVKPYWSNSCSMCMCAKSLQSCPTLCETVDRQAPLSMGFSSEDAGVGCQAVSFESPALAGRFFTASATWETLLPHREKLSQADKEYLINAWCGQNSVLMRICRLSVCCSWWCSKELLDVFFVTNKAVEI